MGRPWEEFQITGEAVQAKPWEAFQGVDMPEQHSALASAGMHAIQGATGGFSDELQGLGEAAGRVVGVKGAGGPMKDMGIATPTMDWETLRDAYRAARDHERKALAEESNQHPIISGASDIAGSVVSPINKIAKGLSLAKGGAALGAINGLGRSNAEDAGGMAKDTAIGTGLGFAGGKVADYLGGAPEALKDSAEKLAVNATGATGRQSAEFADNAGRELLDRGIVKFGDNQAKIAERAARAVQDSEGQIDSALSRLDEKGITVDGNALKEKLLARAKDLAKDQSASDIRKGLESEIGNIESAMKAKGTPNYGMQELESIKRGYGRKAGNWGDPEAGQVGKELYGLHRQAVEDAATAADPSIANAFKEGKESYGLLAPIEEAAERRALTTQQSPHGGLLDMATAGAGMAAAGPLGAVAPSARRVIAPRLASSGAVAADRVSKMLMASPRFAQMAEQNPQAFSAMASSLARKIGPESALKAADNSPDQKNIVSADEAKKKFLDGN